MKNVITQDECTEIIKKVLKSTKATVHSFDVKIPTGDYPGFCAEYCRIRIEYDDNGVVTTKQFFAKSLPINNQKQREIITKYGVFQKEVDLTKNLLPELLKYSDPKKWCPEFFLIRNDIMVMEDVECIGFKMMSPQFEYTQAHMFEAIKSLALFHMAGICFENKKLKVHGTNYGEKYKNMLFQTSFFHGSPWTETGFRAVQTVALEKTKYGFGSKFEEFVRTKMFILMKKTFDLCKNPKSKVPYTWIHQDLWNNNLMFKYDDSKDFSKPQHCYIVDFGISSYLPLTIDVLMIIFLNTKRHHRTSMLEKYLKFYYQTLQDELLRNGISNLFSWEDFRDSCDQFMLLPLVMKSLYLSSTYLPTDLLIHLSQTDEEAYHKFMMESRDQEVLNHMECDEWYSNMIKDATEELVEYLLTIT